MGQGGPRQAFDHAQTGYPLAGKHAHARLRAVPQEPAPYLGHGDGLRRLPRGRAPGTVRGPGLHAPATPSRPGSRPPASTTRRRPGPSPGRTPPSRARSATRPQGRSGERPALTYRVFRAVAGEDCASCHEDAHKGRLGTNCATCHSTAGWRGAGVDRRVRPREDRLSARAAATPPSPARSATCRGGRCASSTTAAPTATPTRTPASSRSGADGGRCESCHDVNGFRPARFGLEDHAKTRLPPRRGPPRRGLRPVPPAGAAAARARSGRGAAPLRVHALRRLPQGPAPRRGRRASWRRAAARPATASSPGARSPSTTRQTKYPLSGATRGSRASPATGGPRPGQPTRLRFAGAAAGLRGLPPRPPPGPVRARGRPSPASAVTPPTT